MCNNRRIKIVTGHFGSGKTEIAINLAFQEKMFHARVALNDLDVINTYYRSRDAAKELKKSGIELIAPKEKLATADLPIVSGEIYRILHDSSYRLIVDAGGDQDGATALGQYYHEWKDQDVEMIFVLNANRPYVSSIDGILSTISRIEAASRLKVTGIINNSNVGHETTLEDISQGLTLSEIVSEKLEIPFLFTTISNQFKIETNSFASKNHVMFLQRFIKLPWES